MMLAASKLPRPAEPVLELAQVLVLERVLELVPEPVLELVPERVLELELALERVPEPGLGLGQGRHNQQQPDHRPVPPP